MSLRFSRVPDDDASASTRDTRRQKVVNFLSHAKALALDPNYKVQGRNKLRAPTKAWKTDSKRHCHIFAKYGPYTVTLTDNGDTSILAYSSSAEDIVKGIDELIAFINKGRADFGIDEAYDKISARFTA
jgi:hypothetical protein